MAENVVIAPGLPLTIAVDASIQLPALYAPNALICTFD
jgi:hypothetical protein